jgi:hypothetical protein
MQPPAAEVNRKARTIDYGPRSTAKPRTCLDDKTSGFCRAKPLAGCNAGGTPADDYDLDIAARHCEILCISRNRREAGASVDAADLRVTVGNALLPSLSLAVATVIPYRLQSAVRIAFLNESFSRGVTCNGIGQEATMGRATSTSGWPTPYFSNTSEPNSVLSTTSFSYAT